MSSNRNKNNSLNGFHHSSKTLKNTGNWHSENFGNQNNGENPPVDLFNHCTNNNKNIDNWHVNDPRICPEGFTINGYLGPNMYNKFESINQELALTNATTPNWNQQVSEIGR